jgi:HlyD family type I secretion membrane fusion protein
MANDNRAAVAPQAPAAPGQGIVQRTSSPRPANNDNWLIGVLSEGRILMRRQNAKIDDFLPDVEAITERRHSPFATLMVFLLFSMVAAAVIWMAVSKLDQVASAPAVVRPTGKAKIVNHPDGGRVAQVLVTEGQDVQRGDVLVRFNADLINQEIDKLVAQYTALAGDVARLTAETSGTPLVFPDDLADQPRLRADEESLYRSRQDQLRNQRAASDAQIEQVVAKTEGLKEQIAGLTDSEKYLRQQEQALKKVTDMKYFPEIRYLSVMRDLSELQGKLGQARRELQASERA